MAIKRLRTVLNLFFCLIVPAAGLASYPVRAETIFPQIHLTPWEGDRGSVFRIKGGPFTKSTVVKFYFSGDPGSTSDDIDGKIDAYHYLGSVWTNAAGYVDNDTQPPGNQAVYQVPFRLDSGTEKTNTPGGACYVYATYNSGIDIVAFAKFNVTSPATLKLDAQTGYVGDSLAASGGSYGINEKVTVKLDDREIPITSGNLTTGAGEVKGTVIVPDATAGQHTLYITDETGNTGNATFTVLSRITLNTTAQAFGGRVTLTGTGFSPRKAVTVSINGRDLIPEEDPVTTSSFGRFQATVTVPFEIDFAKGGNAKVSASVGTAAADAEFDIIKSEPVIAFTPEIDDAHPAAVGMKVGVNGMWFAAGDSVVLAVEGTGVSFGPLAVDAQGRFATEFVLPAISSGTRRFTAKGASVSASRDFVIESGVPAVPTLRSPRVTGETGDAPQLEWTPVNDPSGVTYDLQVAPDRDFRVILVDKHGLSGSAYLFTTAEGGKLVRGGAPCYWRVRAVDGALNTSAWTAASSFYVGFSWTSVPPWAVYAAVGAGTLLLLGMYLFFRKRRRAAGSGSLN